MIFNFKKIKRREGGFTIIELLVVMAIVAFTSTFSLSSYNKFGRVVELDNSAYNVAFSIREAQVFGINRREDDLTINRHIGASSDPIPYGVYFDISSSPVFGIGPTGFLNFIDIVRRIPQDQNFLNVGSETGNCFNSNNTTRNSSECLSIVTLNGGVYIDEICAGTEEINCSSVESLHISFKRPDPDAVIIDHTRTKRSYAEITLKTPKDPDLERTVSVGSAGQITIK